MILLQLCSTGVIDTGSNLPLAAGVVDTGG
jgi:hypothetical protein